MKTRLEEKKQKHPDYRSLLKKHIAKKTTNRPKKNIAGKPKFTR